MVCIRFSKADTGFHGTYRVVKGSTILMSMGLRSILGLGSVPLRSCKG